MPEDRAPRGGPGGDGLAGLGIVALAIGCCAGLPLIAALAGSVAAGTLLRVGAGLVAAVVVVAVVALRVRARRRACEPRVARQSSTPHRGSATSRRAPVLPRRR